MEELGLDHTIDVAFLNTFADLLDEMATGKTVETIKSDGNAELVNLLLLLEIETTEDFEELVTINESVRSAVTARGIKLSNTEDSSHFKNQLNEEKEKETTVD